MVSKMLIPRHHRLTLKKACFRYWLWYQISNWAYGERYKFRDGNIAYLKDDEIITVRRGAKILWRREK